MFLIYGLQKSGISILKFFEKKKYEFRIWDDNPKVRKYFKKFLGNKILYNPNRNTLNHFESIFVSPGISLRKKIFNENNNKNKLKRDLNLYLSHVAEKNIIAVTGTNGKSTTTKLIGDILKKNNIKTFVGGNIGNPLCNSLISNTKYDYHIIELSSFQLEAVKKINTKISIITNIAHDHLDRYNSLSDYVNQKKNIISKYGINIISIDDEFSKKIFLQKKIKNKISFSIHSKSANIFMGENFILDNYFKKNKKIFLNKISKDLEGNFNKQNILIAYICSNILKLDEKIFAKKIEIFKGLPFRSNVIFNNKRFKIINNSKSTNINSAISLIKNYENIYLILGGIAKEKNFEIFNNYKNRISNIYIFGKSASFIEKKITKDIATKKFNNLKILLQQVFRDLKKNKIKLNILFSPACSSYDQYNNFEERGEEFTKLVKLYLNKL